VRELDDYFLQHPGEEEPFLLYLYGVALIHQKNTKEALSKLISSVTIFPYNWSAWQEILKCVDSLDKFKVVATLLPRHLMGRIFNIYALQEFYQHDTINLDEIDDILTFLPEFNFLIIQKALMQYHGLNYTESEQAFEKVLKNDPHRLDDMDTYSNILYVMERRPKLAYLAQLASSTDKFRPETCCIIANYYSLKSEHEKSITYYQRALTLNRNCLSAWTLMGHEFVELKNTHAAIESYRHAIDVNKKDFRAWYGLGQAYEVLDMNYYSLYYYQRAAALKPYDARMWQALGNCYEKLGKIDEAIKSYKRSLKLSDMDPVILLRIALIYEKLGDFDQCAQYMRMCLHEEESEGVTEETSQARLWLAKFELSKGRYRLANDYAKLFSRGSAAELEEARAIVRETRTRLDQ
jgi:anaphase-promoting complex subunit 8